MNDEKGKKTHKRGIFKNYLIYIISFLAIALAVMICAIIIINKPATDFVHNIESNFAMEVRDIEINDSYPDTDNGEYKFTYGDLMGNVSIESCGLNCNIYYGDNRVSYRNGVGYAENSGEFGSGKLSVIKGFDETYFSCLKYAEVGDIITVTIGDNSYNYRIMDTEYIDADIKAYQSDDEDMLVLCGICSDFSDHSGEYFYVFADRTNREGN